VVSKRSQQSLELVETIAGLWNLPELPSRFLKSTRNAQLQRRDRGKRMSIAASERSLGKKRSCSAARRVFLRGVCSWPVVVPPEQVRRRPRWKWRRRSGQPETAESFSSPEQVRRRPRWKWRRRSGQLKTAESFSSPEQVRRRPRWRWRRRSGEPECGVGQGLSHVRSTKVVSTQPATKSACERTSR
jgi:hypothetical protein